MPPTIPDPNITDDAEDDSEYEARPIPRYLQANTYNDLQKTVLDALHEAYQRRLSSQYLVDFFRVDLPDELLLHDLVRYDAKLYICLRDFLKKRSVIIPDAASAFLSVHKTCIFVLSYTIIAHRTLTRFNLFKNEPMAV
jgi:hypothetical protein